MKRISQLLRIFAFGTMASLAVSCGDQPQLPEIQGVKGPFFNVMDGKVLISMTLEQMSIIGGARIPLEKLPNSYVEVTPAQFGGTFFQVALSLEEIEGTDWTLVDPQALPGGRPLPGVVGGQLPSFAVTVPDLADSTFYVSKKVFGFFLPMKVDAAGALITFRLYMQDKHIGNISVVGQDQNGEHSGLLLLLNLNNSGKAQLKALLQHSKKAGNRNKMY
jgi:hypothetical protein